MPIIRKRRRLRTSVTTLESLKTNEWKRISNSLDTIVHCSKEVFRNLQDKPFTCRDTCSKIDLHDLAVNSLIKNPKTMWIVCMDERIQYYASSHRALSIGLPGSECLVRLKDKQLLTSHLSAVCREFPSIEEIIVTSHASCGAVHKALCSKPNRFEQAIQKILSHNTHYCDQAAKKYTAEFALELDRCFDKEDLDVEIRTLHLDQEQLHCPNFHNAVGAVVNYIPNFNVSEFCDQLDIPLFNIYAQGQSVSLIKSNIELAIAIASQDCGLGRYFNQENPFTIIFTGYNSITKDILKALSKVNFSIPVAYTICPL